MKHIIIILLCFFYSYGYMKTENKNFVEYNVKNNFDDIIYSLEDEMINNGFTVSFRSDLGKSVNMMSKYLKESPIFLKAKKIGFCKNSLGHKLMKENKKNIIYCPIDIVIYEEDENNITILYETAKSLKDTDTVVFELNKIITTLIENIIK